MAFIQYAHIPKTNSNIAIPNQILNNNHLYSPHYGSSDSTKKQQKEKAVLTTFCAILIKIGPLNPEITRVETVFWDDTAKIDISHAYLKK